MKRETGGTGGLVSVIIPVYNVRPYLEETLESVIHQTYKNLEILLVDDGSEDGSGEICGRYAEADSRVRIIHQNHRGPGAARNAGLDVMRGEYTAFLDSDDAFRPEMIETLLGAMEREGTDTATCRYAQCFTRGRLDRAKAGKAQPDMAPGVYDRNEIFHALADGRMNLSVCNRLYRAALWRDVRFPEGRVYEDAAIICPVFRQTGKAAVLPDLLYLYRRHPESITRKISPQKYRDWTVSMGEFDRFVEENTPGIFTEEELLKIHRKRLGWLLYEHARQPLGEMEPGETEQLRNRIRALGRETKGRGNGAAAWLSWQAFRCSPRLQRFLYGIYDRVSGKRMGNRGR